MAISPASNVVWGWLFAACMFVLVGCSILTVNAHITLNDYQATRAADISMLRREIASASLSQSETLRTLILNSNDQTKQYIDVQIPVKVKDAVSSIVPQSITLTQTANPAIQASPTLNNK
ncbi:hypothetical protein DOZ69_14035 [Pseudomonas fluorescens]|uniref:Putative exported protein n=1 Tax=Pseudomonas fluorescens (strain Pf0-1) TaxID=205922 RepID=Q3KAG9_PSEPF|nr:putative exported protein [Pseudomonas fluorescens Pf0-1]RAI66052.1 hypothetical protein DOZ69_14035 [Pseudomonas fluorescens]